jgi:uncharacterized phage protein (TIGR02220 family)
LQWAKIYFDMVQGDPDCELIESEIDWARLVKMILLELRARKPLPNSNRYWVKNGFDVKKRPMSLTLQMLHNFVDIGTELSKDCAIEKSKRRVDKEEDKDKSRVEEIMYDLNLVLGSSYKETVTKTVQLIKARLNEGFTIEDFKTVHRKMLKCWGADEEMYKYLRPITLYSPKFESYLNMREPVTKLTETGVKAYYVGQAWLKKSEVVDVGQN